MRRTTRSAGTWWLWPTAIVTATAVVFAVHPARWPLEAPGPVAGSQGDAASLQDAAAPPGAGRVATGSTAAPDGVGASPVRLEERAPDELVAQALGGANVEDRVAALDALAYAAQGSSGKQGYVQSTLAQALADPDERIRGQAMVTLREAVPELPETAVAQIARDDPSPTLRIQALELLVERSGESALAPLRLALVDPDAAVRERARGLVEDAHLGVAGLAPGLAANGTR